MSKIRTFSRSGLVGIAATLVDLGALVLFVEPLGMPPVWANVPALLLGLLVQFFGNKFFAFSDHSKDYVRQGGLFALVEICAFTLNAIAFHLLVVVFFMPYLPARLLGSSMIYFAFSFPLWRLIFRPRRTPHRWDCQSDFNSVSQSISSCTGN